MSLSNEWDEFHLTPVGWVEGSSKQDFCGVTEVPAPPDRALSIRFREYQSCSYAKVDRTRREMWRSPDADAVAALVEEYGSCPKGYESWQEES